MKVMTRKEAAEVLREALECRCEGNYGTATHAARRALNESLKLAIELLERDRWISVEERLPEPDVRERYIVYAIEPYFGTGVVDFMRFDGELWFYDSVPTEATVTHWMPLPEPPKEDT